MSQPNNAAHPHFGRTRAYEAAAELVLTLAAAGFTAAIWLSVAAFAIPQAQPVQELAATHITLPTVVIVGRRDSLAEMPVATTAQNTAAFPVNLKQ